MGTLWIIEWFIGFAGLSAILSYAVMIIERKKRYLAPDAHKPGHPLVPKSGGIALLISYSVLSVISYMYGLKFVYMYSVSIVASGILGLIDDVVGIGAVKKVGIFALPALIPVLTHSYISKPYVPVINGTLRLTILYPILFIIGYTVSANALNMTDTHNGTAPTATLAILSSMLIASLIFRRVPPLHGALIFLVASLGVFTAYMPFNAYPARMFNGNCGSFLMGAVLASAMALTREEFLYILLMMPLILNGFSILSSIRGFKSKESIPLRPVSLGRDWRIRPVKHRRAPVTLIQLLVLRRPLSEKEVVVAYTLLFIASCVTALITYYVLLNI